jgi:chaperone required for assembly of F1-ATPase
VKRFWKQVEVVETGDGFGVALDGRRVKTPGRNDLIVPSKALADAIAEEWRGCGDNIDPRAMPLTGLANAAVERVVADTRAFAAGLANYAESDLTCYRAEGPATLAARQAESWDALLGWARRRYDVDFVTCIGVMHVAQPIETLRKLRHAVASLDHYQLAGLSPLVTIGGSLIAALAVLEEMMPVEDVWEAVSLDERWQLEQWGDDPEARTALDARRRDFLAAASFLELLRG